MGQNARKKAYYNEIDKFAAAWLRELIKAGLIADGEVDERSIADVQPGDLRGFTQCHFFAGIGGWSYALRLAGWDDDREAWTGSCPCQPFSAAGKGAGADDSRDLWPTWFQLIQECRPATVFGEQVASADGLGWFDRVSADVEAQDYAVAAVDLCAAGIGAFHIRQRLWFVADSSRGRLGINGIASGHAGHVNQREQVGAVADASCERRQQVTGSASGDEGQDGRESDADYQPASDGKNFWSSVEWMPCADGKARPVEPGTFPLAHGIPARVGRLRGYGNAIVPQVAQVFIEAYLEARAHE